MELIQFMEVPGPINIYGSSLITLSKFLKLLIAVKNQVFCFQKNSKIDSPPWELTPLLLNNIPSDGEIISLDVFSEDINWSDNSSSLISPILGITICYQHSPLLSNEIKPPKSLFNIYVAPSDNNNLDDISVLFSSAEECQTIEIEFIPFQLKHSPLNQSKFRSFLLSGSDAKIHLFQQDPKTNKFFETNVLNIYPQLDQFTPHSNIISFDIKEKKNKTILAFGTQNGELHVIISDDTSTRTEMLLLDGPISCVELFSLYAPKLERDSKFHPAILDLHKNMKSHAPLSIFSPIDDEPHLCVADAIGYSALFQNISNQDPFNEATILPESQSYDTITCIKAIDLDFDGRNEIVIGTYGQELIIYKEETTPSSLKTSSSTNLPLSSQNNMENNTLTSSSSSGEVKKSNCSLKYVVKWRYQLSQPIMRIHWGDLTQDGGGNLIVVTLRGINIFQVDIENTKERVLKSLTLLKEIRLLEEKLEKEQKRKTSLNITLSTI